MNIRDNLKTQYSDVYTGEALDAIAALSEYNSVIKQVMATRIDRRLQRQQKGQRISFLNPSNTIPRTAIKVQDARDGKFEGSTIPVDLQRQWVQGTGPAAKPGVALERSLRNVAYALLSGADGWMFDGEDALGQTTTMSLDNQRNLKLAIHYDPVFLKVAEQVASEMNKWSADFFRTQDHNRLAVAAEVHDKALPCARPSPG